MRHFEDLDLALYSKITKFETDADKQKQIIDVVFFAMEAVAEKLQSQTAGKVTIVKEKFYHADKELIDKLQADNARFLEALLESDGWLEYLNPEELPDAQHHKAFDDFAWKLESILASTDKSNWLAEHDAEVQLRILDACWNTVSANQCWEIAAKLGIDIDKLRRMAEQPESK